MMFRRKQRTIPELNTTSTADISFMLLVFFLVTTSMNVDKGMRRQLPPINKEQTTQTTDVDRATLLTVKLQADGTVLVDEKPVNMAMLANKALTLMTQHGAQHLISLEADPKARYDTYFQVQDCLLRTYQQWRNSEAKRRYHRSWNALSSAQRDDIRNRCPQRIAEKYNGTENPTNNKKQEETT